MNSVEFGSRIVTAVWLPKLVNQRLGLLNAIQAASRCSPVNYRL